MTYLRTLFAMSLAAVIPCSVGARLPQPISQSTRDAEQVKRFFMEGIDRFNRHDLDGFMIQFDPDIRMYSVTQWLTGSPSLRQRFASTFAQFPDVHMDITDLRAQSVAPGVVTVQFEFHTFPNGSGPAYHGVGSGTYVKGSHGWREVQEHETVSKRDAGLLPPARTDAGVREVMR